MAQLPDLESHKSLGGLPADHQPVGGPAEFAAEVFSAALDCDHGEVLLVK